MARAGGLTTPDTFKSPTCQRSEWDRCPDRPTCPITPGPFRRSTAVTRTSPADGRKPWIFRVPYFGFMNSIIVIASGAIVDAQYLSTLQLTRGRIERARTNGPSVPQDPPVRSSHLGSVSGTEVHKCIAPPVAPTRSPALQRKVTTKDTGETSTCSSLWLGHHGHRPTAEVVASEYVVLNAHSTLPPPLGPYCRPEVGPTVRRDDAGIERRRAG